MSEPRARIREATEAEKELIEPDPNMRLVQEVNEDDVLVLDDPDAVAVMRAVEKHNCRTLFEDSAERVEYFKGRLAIRGLDPKDFCIVLLNVDDPHGGSITEILMPGNGAQWQSLRDQGMTPIARGMASRQDLSEIVKTFDKEAGEKLQSMEGTVVLVVDRGVAEVFPT